MGGIQAVNFFHARAGTKLFSLMAQWYLGFLINPIKY